MSPNSSDACLEALLERKTTPGVDVSTGPPKYAVSERFFSASSFGKISLRSTRAGLLTIRPTTKPFIATTEDGNINTTHSLKVGSPSSGRATRKRVVLSPLPLSDWPCAACTVVLVKRSKMQKAIAVRDLSLNIQFSSPSGGCYASYSLDTTELPQQIYMEPRR